MIWSDIDPALREHAALNMGYKVTPSRVPQLGRGALTANAGVTWSWISPGMDYPAPGETSEKKAWDRAFQHLCRTSHVYRHKKGGIYKSCGAARSSEDKSKMVLYLHLAPHASEMWVRPLDEFMEPGRFERVTA